MKRLRRWWAGRLVQSEIPVERLRAMLRVEETHPVLMGVRELARRVTVTAIETAGDEAVPMEERVGAATRVAAIRDLMVAVEKWRTLEMTD